MSEIINAMPIVNKVQLIYYWLMQRTKTVRFSNAQKYQTSNMYNIQKQTDILKQLNCK